MQEKKLTERTYDMDEFAKALNVKGKIREVYLKLAPGVEVPEESFGDGMIGITIIIENKNKSDIHG